MSNPRTGVRIQARAKRGRPRGNGTQRVYDALRDEILMLSMAPGSHIDEAAIESRFAISRTPIREALIRLQADGLVRFLPNRGYYVSSIDFTDLPRAFESLDLLQTAVLQLAALRRTEEDLVRMTQENDSYLSASTAGDHTAMTEANHRFHLACGAAARNEFLSSAYESVLNYNLRITRLAFATQGKSVEGRAYYDRIYSEHAEMMALIRARDSKALAAVSRRHVQLFQGKIAGFLQSAAWLDADVVEYDFETT